MENMLKLRVLAVVALFWGLSVNTQAANSQQTKNYTIFCTKVDAVEKAWTVYLSSLKSWDKAFTEFDNISAALKATQKGVTEKNLNDATKKKDAAFKYRDDCKAKYDQSIEALWNFLKDTGAISSSVISLVTQGDPNDPYNVEKPLLEKLWATIKDSLSESFGNMVKVFGKDNVYNKMSIKTLALNGLIDAFYDAWNKCDINCKFNARWLMDQEIKAVLVDKRKVSKFFIAEWQKWAAKNKS